MNQESSVASAQTLSNLRWISRLRWVAILGQAATILVVWRWLDPTLPIAALLGIVSLHALLNAFAVSWLSHDPEVRPWLLTLHMAGDFVQLTALLALSGGPSNPFSVLYLVHVALSAVVLSPRHAWSLAALSTVLFGLLFTTAQEHAMHHGGSMGLHLQGMWIAFAIAAAVIVHFVSRVASDLERQRAAAENARLLALRSEKLASLATLAAGAAHELATPLSTIAVVAKELEHSLRAALPEASADVELIRSEVARCRDILENMASDAGESAGEAFVAVSAEAVVEGGLAELPGRARVRLENALTNAEVVRIPKRAVMRIVRGLIKNALEASEGEVCVRLWREADWLHLEVIDRGRGIPAELLARVGEPFFTTKEPGRGMGLGVFLARVTLERLGGRFALSSAAGKGTTALVSLRRDVAWSAEQS